MSVITSENRQAWQDLADDLSVNRPSIGKIVQVIKGKHAGKVGRVVWHGRDKFSTAYHYCNEAQSHMRDMEGKAGWRVAIQTIVDLDYAKSEKIFVSAENVEINREDM